MVVRGVATQVFYRVEVVAPQGDVTVAIPVLVLVVPRFSAVTTKKRVGSLRA